MRYPHTGTFTRASFGAQDPDTGLPGAPNPATVYDGACDVQGDKRRSRPVNGTFVEVVEAPVFLPEQAFATAGIALGDSFEYGGRSGEVVEVSDFDAKVVVRWNR